MADLLWVRIRTGVHRMTRHAIRFDNPDSTMCGLEIDDSGEIVDQISITDDVCNNCLRILGQRADVEEAEPVEEAVEPTVEFEEPIPA